ncbi:hypothetical protein [Erysipelothrix rhusiopathiae]|nr:hypothetical protein [Erysipelothrix rhusiopathiae]
MKSSSVIKNPVNKIIVNGTYEARGSISDGYATEVITLLTRTVVLKD